LKIYGSGAGKMVMVMVFGDGMERFFGFFELGDALQTFLLI
jgi:hypothetical protein